jgi:sortase A
MASPPQIPGSRDAAAQSSVRLLDEHDRRVVVLDAASRQGAGEPASLQTMRRGRGWSRARRTLAAALIVLGVLALADAIVTLVWQEPLSALYARLRQDHLSGVLRKEERASPTAAEHGALARLASERARIRYLAASLQRHAGDGDPVGRIRIPRIGANFVVVYGTSTAALQSGPGVFPETLLPGRGGTTAIAGHRTTYLAPFRHIDELRRGNSITLEMPYAHFTYRVTGSRVVAPTDVGAAVDYVGYPRLVLSACTPLFSAAKRILVFARLVRTTPVHAARTHAARTHASRTQGSRRTRAARGTPLPRRLTTGARSRSAPPPGRGRRATLAPAGP